VIGSQIGGGFSSEHQQCDRVAYGANIVILRVVGLAVTPYGVPTESSNIVRWLIER